MKKVILTFAVLAMTQVGLAQAKKSAVKTDAAPVTATAVATSSTDEAFKKDVMKVIERGDMGGQMSQVKKQILGMIPEDKQAAFLVEFDADLLVLGGNIARCHQLFLPKITQNLKIKNVNLPIIIIENTEETSIIGSTYLFNEVFWERIKEELPYF